MFIFSKKLNFQQKIFIYFVIFLILPFAIFSYFLGYNLENEIEKKVNDLIGVNMQISSNGVRETFEDMMAICIDISTNRDVLHLLEDPEYFKIAEKHRILDYTMISSSSKYLPMLESHVTIIDFNENLYTTWYHQKSDYGRITGLPWYRQILGGNDKYTVISDNYIENTAGKFISVAMVIEDYKKKEKQGVVVVSVEENSFQKSIAKLQINDRHKILVVNDKNHTAEYICGMGISEKEYDGVKTSLILEKKDGLVVLDGKANLFYNYTIKNTNLKIIQILPRELIFQDISSIRNFNILTLLAFLLCMLVITIIISTKLTRNLKLLTEKMASMSGKGRFEVIEIKDSISNEVTKLMDAYNNMIVRIEELTENIEKEHKQKEEERFKALQAQISPHFILNTLNCIKWLIYSDEKELAMETVEAFGGMLEESMHDKEDFITIDKEIQYIRNYIYIQKIRWGGNLEVNYNIDSMSGSSRVFKFILQPIVENCIKHAFDKIEIKGEIKITAQKIGSQVRIAVEDNGRGMSEYRLQSLRKILSEACTIENDSDDGGIGLKNIERRLKLLFGDEYGIKIDSTSGKGTKVEINLPYIEMG